MPIRTEWETDEKKVLLSIYEGKWDLDEFYAAVQVINTMMDTVDHEVNIILDMHNSRALPKGFIGAIRHTGKQRHPCLGTMVLVGGNTLVRMFNDMFLKLYPRPSSSRAMYMVANYEEAHAIFARTDIN
jgi:hypothetical protein